MITYTYHLDKRAISIEIDRKRVLFAYGEEKVCIDIAVLSGSGFSIPAICEEHLNDALIVINPDELKSMDWYRNMLGDERYIKSLKKKFGVDKPFGLC